MTFILSWHLKKNSPYQVKPFWRLIPVSKWLITMVILSPLSMVVSLPNGRTSWLVNGGLLLITTYPSVLGAHPPRRGFTKIPTNPLEHTLVVPPYERISESQIQAFELTEAFKNSGRAKLWKDTRWSLSNRMHEKAFCLKDPATKK